MAALIEMQPCAADWHGIRVCGDLCNTPKFGCGNVFLAPGDNWTAEGEGYICYCAGCNDCPVTGAWDWADGFQAVVFTLQVAFFVRNFRAFGRVLRRGAAATCSKLLRRQEDSREASAQQVMREVEQVMLRRRRDAFITIAKASNVFTAAVCWDHVTKGWQGRLWLTPAQQVLESSVFLIAALISLFPRMLTIRNCQASASLCYVCLVLLVSHPIADIECYGDDEFVNRSYIDDAYFMPAVVMLFRLPFSLMILEWRLSVFWNMVYSGVVVVGFMTVGYDSCPVGFERIYQELFQLTAFVALIIMFNAYWTSQARLEVRSRISESELQATDSLLNITCDAVVEVDANFRITKEANRFNVLMLRERQRSLVGKDFSEFLFSADDRARFAEVAGRAATDGAAFAEVFHVHIRDGQGSKMSVEVFHVFVNGPFELRHVLGMKEMSDEAAPSRKNEDQFPPPGPGASASLSQEVGGASAGAGAGAALMPGPALQKYSPNNAPGDASEESGPGGLSQARRRRRRRFRPQLDDDEGSVSSGSSGASSAVQAPEVAAWIDFTTDSYDILNHTLGFEMAFGASAASRGLLSQIKQSDRDAFVAWLQESYFALQELHDGVARAPVRRDARVVLRPAAQRQFGLQVSATVEVDLEPPPDEIEPGARTQHRIRVLLNDLVWSQARKRPGAHEARGTPCHVAQGGQFVSEGGLPRHGLPAAEQPALEEGSVVSKLTSL